MRGNPALLSNFLRPGFVFFRFFSLAWSGRYYYATLSCRRNTNILACGGCLVGRLLFPLYLLAGSTSFPLTECFALILALETPFSFLLGFLSGRLSIARFFFYPCKLKHQHIEVVIHKACCRQLVLPCSGPSTLKVAALLHL